MRKHKKFINLFVWFYPLVLSTLFLPLVSCKTIGSRTQSDEDNNVDSLGRRLGSGYDTRDYRKLSSCIDTSNFLYGGANSSELAYIRDSNYDQLIDQVGGGIYAKASLFGLVSAKVQGDIATSLATTDNTAAFLYGFDLRGKSAFIENAKFNGKGSTAFNSNDRIAFREGCGNQYVDQVTLGGQLIVGVKYTFTSKEAKDQIKLKISAELFWGLIKVSKTWSKEMRDLLKNLIVTVEAYQIGGDPRILKNLVASINNVPCVGDQVDRCAEVADRLLKYGREEFSVQLNDLKLTDEPYKGPAILSVSTKDYSQESIYDPISKSLVSVEAETTDTPAQDVAEIQTRLEKMKSDLKIALARVKILATFSLSKDEANLVKLSRQDIEGVLSNVISVRDSICESALRDQSLASRCSAEAGDMETKTKKALKPLDLASRF